MDNANTLNPDEPDTLETSATTLKLLTAEALLSHEVHILASNSNAFHWHSLATLYTTEAQSAITEGQEEKAKSLSLFAQLLNIHFKPADRANVWGPMYQTGGRRSIIPSDIKGAQTDELLKTVEHIAHPAVRARMADVAWTNNKRNVVAANQAIAAYVECVTKVLNGELKEYSDETGDLVSICDHLVRAFQIARAISGKKLLPDPLQQALKDYYARAKERTAFVACRRSAELGCGYEVLDGVQVAAELEAVASADVGKPYPYAIQPLYEYAASLYRKAGNAEAERRCLLAAVDQMLAMRSQVSGAAAEATWVKDAILALRRIPNTGDKKAELEKELARLQVASTEQMAMHSIDLGIKGEWEATYEQFCQYDLVTGIRNFALVDHVPTEEELKQEARDQITNSPLLATMNIAYTDANGKVTAKAPGADPYGNHSEAWYDSSISRSEPLRRQVALGSAIEPARRALTTRFSIGEEHIAPIVDCSFLVPIYQKPVVTIGFTRLLQGDYISATYILIPQVEAMLRHILQARGFDPAKRRDDGTEEDKGLGGMFANFRTELQQTLTPTVVYYLEHLFDKDIGPGLRHQLAHGKIAAGGCFDSDVVYACWFLFHLVVRSVQQQMWDTVVGPAIAENEGTS